MRWIKGLVCDRARRGACVVVALAWAWSSAAPAQAQPFVFTKIADTVSQPGAGLGGVTCVSMNNHGVVVVRGGNVTLWRGDGASFSQVSSAAGSLCASINDLGEIAYLKANSPSLGVTSLVRNSGGVETTLARTDVTPRLDTGTTHLPSLTLGGRAVYVAQFLPNFGDKGIFIAPAGTKVYNPQVDPPLNFSSPSSMNDSETAVFVATDAGGVAGIYRGSAVPLIETGDLVSGGVILVTPFTRPVINNSGKVAFVGRLDIGATTGTYGVYTTDTGGSVTLVGRDPLGALSINASGAVAYRKTGASNVIAIGRPGALDQKVIGIGDPLDGSTVASLTIWEEGLNDDGQVAFAAQLADGRTGIFRADPQWLTSLSFTQKIPGCGPINGKLKLTVPAPFGGLTVRLANTNPSASIPLNVTVPKGKTAGTFPITPSVVLANVTGAVTASVAAQSSTRALTVRPITVARLTVAPNPIVGGNTASGTVTLDCAAPHDIAVALASKVPTVAHPNASTLFFPPGAVVLTFPITTLPVIANKGVAIRAGAYGVTKSTTLTVTP